MLRLLALAGWFVLILVPACLPIPRAHVPLALPAPTYRMAPDAVPADYLSIPGADEPHTPAALDRSCVLRLRAAEPPKAVLVMVPGLFGGAGSLEILGRQLVAATPGLEVWLVDRRSNALEDHRGFDAARVARNPELALRYYLGEPGWPPSFAPPTPESIRFMAYWGLQVHLRDLDAIVDRAHRAAPRVYLGGHSLGASLAALYVAHLREDGRAGGDEIAGLVLLDGAPGRTGAFDLADAVDGRRLAGYTIVPSLAELESGRAVPYLGPGIVPQRIVRSAVIATYARYRPDALAPVALTDLRITDFALAGVAADDTYAELPSFAPALGEATHAETSGYVLPFLLEGVLGARSRSVVGVAPGADRIQWSEGDPPEATDLASYVRSVTGPDTDRAEWYFPVRLLIEMARLPVDLHDAPGFVPTASVRVPTLAIGAGRGMIRDVDGFSAYANARLGSSFTRYVVPAVTHVDLVTARDAPVVPIVQSWMGLAGAAP